jgi:hypothetical protein
MYIGQAVFLAILNSFHGVPADKMYDPREEKILEKPPISPSAASPYTVLLLLLLVAMWGYHSDYRTVNPYAVTHS